MKPKQILTDLMLLEGQLNNFSFEELTMEEAAQLKKSFVFFKNRLEEKVNRVKLTENTHTSDSGTVDSRKAPDPIPYSPVPINEESLLVKLHHEFRTPINEILGLADLIQEGALDQEQRAQLEAVSRIAHDLSGTLNELQEYIELSTGKEKFEKIEFDPSRIIKDTMFLCNAMILHKEVKLSMDIDRNIPAFLIGDPSKLSQILLYLLGNIIKCINEGDIHLQIGLREDLGETCLLNFQISHQGIGKSQTDLEQFYNSLARSETPNFGNFLDNGIGPAIIKLLVRNLNGGIPVARTMGKDIAFSFNLPYLKGTGTKQVNRHILAPRKTHLEKTWQECSGEVKLVEEMIGLFKGNILEFIGKLKIYIPTGEFEKIQTAARKVRASACLMQADGLLPIIDSVLTNCRTVRDIHYLNMLYEQFLSAYPSLEQAIDKELKLLKNKDKL